MEIHMNLENSKKEMNTKQKILDTAINLFAEKDYKSVSIREIAAAVGIKGSSIYNHFESKDEILDAILEYHMEAANSAFEGYIEKSRISYKGEQASLEETLRVSMEMARKFMEIPKMGKIFRILSQEQLNNDKIRSFFLNAYIIRPRGELEKIFEELIKNDLVKQNDAKQLASEFQSYVIYRFYEHYMLRRDVALDFEAMKEDFDKHVEFFSKGIMQNE